MLCLSFSVLFLSLKAFQWFVSWSAKAQSLMLPVSTDTQWHTGYASVHLRKAWTVWSCHGNNNLMPSKNIYKHNCAQFTESVISHTDEGLATQCIISGGNRSVSHPRRKRKYPSVCLFAFTAWNGNGHARTLRHTRQPNESLSLLLLLFFYDSQNCVTNHSIREGTVWWHHSRYISIRGAVFD